MRTVLLLLMMLLSLALSAGEKPNIIFILADDLGYGDLGCYGQKQVRTPNLDRMAAEGVRFTHAYAGSTVCAPSRCALLTGKHTGHCHIRGNARVWLPPDTLTVARVLKNAGYVTANIGKWGLGDPGTSGVPSKQGFDEFFGFLNHKHAHDYYPAHLYRHEEKVPLPGNENNAQKGAYASDLFTDEALSFVKRQKDKPFFLYLAYTTPHGNNEQISNNDGMQVPSNEPYENETWPEMEKRFAAKVTRMDRDIGKLLALLKELGLDEKTIVFFTSDNGPHREGHSPDFFDSNGPLRGIKRDLYDGGIRVPFIARWPGQIKPAVSEHVCAFWDFLPTAAELAGASAPADIDGLSLVPTLLGKGEQKAHSHLYWEFHERGFTQAVRLGNYKAVRNVNGKPIEIYDVVRDPEEKTDLAATEPERVKQAEALFKTARTDSAEFPIREPSKKK